MSHRDKNRPQPSKKNSAGKSPAEPLPELKKTEFSLKAVSARSVKLAADFTDWDKLPIELSRAENGLWRVTVPLARGDYSYRFIVDGEWCDDPQCADCVPNSFGTMNARVKIS